MEEVNDDFDKIDLSIVIGANISSINPSACDIVLSNKPIADACD